MLRCTSLMAATILIAGCSNPIEENGSAKAEMIAAIDRLYVLEGTCGATEQNTIDAPDATSFGINASTIVSKSDENADAREDQLCAEGGSVEFGPEVAGVRFLSDGVAILHGVSTYREIGSDGSILLDGAFNFTHVFQKTAEGWRIQHTHVAPLFPEN